MHIYVRGVQSKLRKAVWAVASDTEAAFTSVLAACLPACSWVGSSGELLASCSSSSRFFFGFFFKKLRGAQQGTCVSASTQEDKNLHSPPAFSSISPPRRLEATGVEGTETTLQCFWSPQQLCQGVFPQKPHHSHSAGPLLLSLRDDSWWINPEFLIFPPFWTAIRTKENIYSTMHPSKTHRKLLQKMCSFSFLKCLGEDRERIIVSS